MYKCICRCACVYIYICVPVQVYMHKMCVHTIHICIHTRVFAVSLLYRQAPFWLTFLQTAHAYSHHYGCFHRIVLFAWTSKVPDIMAHVSFIFGLKAVIWVLWRSRCPPFGVFRTKGPGQNYGTPTCEFNAMMAAILPHGNPKPYSLNP